MGIITLSCRCVYCMPHVFTEGKVGCLVIVFFCDVMWLLLFLSLRPVLLKINNLFCISVSSRFVLKKFRIIDHCYQLNGRFYQRIETDFAFQTP